MSHSTPEAEIVAADFALRTSGLPAKQLWNIILEGSAGLVFHEDNQAMIRVCQTGRNPTMRHLGRTHSVSVAWLHEWFAELGIACLLYTSDAADDLLCVDLCSLPVRHLKSKVDT